MTEHEFELRATISLLNELAGYHKVRAKASATPVYHEEYATSCARQARVLSDHIAGIERVGRAGHEQEAAR